MSTSASDFGARRPLAARPAVAAVLAIGLAVGLGTASVLSSPLLIGAGLIAVAVGALVVARPTLGLFLFLLVVAILPFGVVPVRIGVQLTFVDVTLIATYLGFLWQLPRLARERPGFVASPAGVWLLLFAFLSVVAYVLGSGLSDPGAEGARRFSKLLASLLFFLVALNLLVRDLRLLRNIARGIALLGAGAGSIATGLWLLAPNIQLNLLNRLGALGYPTGDGVLRYEPAPNGTYTDQLRAVGTAVDPNVLGGTLMLAAAFVLGHVIVGRQRVWPTWLLLALAVPTLAGVLVSFSRASWVGLAAAVLWTGRKDRRVWLAAAAGSALLLTLPIGQRAVTRFTGGFSAADPATALRLGEYRNAATLIGRYPVLGIGFGPSPDIDVTAGVSSVYLLVGEQTGLVGLTAYLLALGSVLVLSRRATRHPSREVATIAAGAQAAFVGALVAGLADHYFANQVFPHAVALFWLDAALLAACAYQPEDVAGALSPRWSGESPGARATPPTPPAHHG